MNKHLLILLILTSSSAFAALNKWVDESGQVHYSDISPPSNIKVKKLNSDSPSIGESSSTAATSAPAAAKTLAEKEAELKKAQKAKQEAADKAAKEQANTEARKSSCATAQQNLRTLQEGIRMVEIDASGERSYMSDEQREQRIASTQKDINNYCK